MTSKITLIVQWHASLIRSCGKRSVLTHRRLCSHVLLRSPVESAHVLTEIRRACTLERSIEQNDAHHGSATCREHPSNSLEERDD
jgi:hypothetical protein